MMLLKLLVGFAFICKTIEAAEKKVETGRKVSFSVEAIWQSYRNKDPCSTSTSPREDDSWKKGVQEYYDGCRTATWLFRGRAFDLADIVVNSLQQYLTKLIYFTNSNSTVIAPSCTAILKTVSRASELNRNGMNIIVQFEKVLPIIIEEFNEAAAKLSVHIGDELTCSFTNALRDLGAEFSSFMRAFVQSCQFFKCKRRVNFKPVFQKLQKLMNTLALIDQTLLNECENEATQEVYDSVLVLHLIYFYMGIAAPGIHSCVLDVLYDRNCLVSKSVKSSSLSFEYALVEVTQAVSAVVLPSNKGVKDLLKIFVNTVMSLNTALKDIFGLFNGVEITVGEIAKNLVKGDRCEVSAAKRQTRILEGVGKNN